MNLALKGLNNVVWKIVDLPELVSFQEGPGVRKHQYTDNGVKLLNVANLRNGKVDLSTSNRYISKDEAYGRYEHFLAEEGDLVIASSGIQISYFEEKMGFIKKEHLPLCMNTSTIRFKTLDDNILDLKYFMYFLKTNYFKKQIQRLITGSAQLNFGPSHLRQIKVILPDITIQKKIVEVLDITQGLIGKRQQQIEALSALKQSVFLDMFGDPVYNTKNWEVKSIEELFEIEDGDRGKAYPKQEDLKSKGILFLSTSNIQKNSFMLDEKKYITHEKFNELRKGKLKKGDIILTLRGTIGNVALFNHPDYETGFINAQMAILRSKGINNSFFCELYSMNVFTEHLKTHQSGSSQPQLPIGSLKKIKIIVPPIKVQNKFEDKVKLIDASISSVKESLKQLNSLYDTLLHKAFNGELFKEEIKA